MPMQFCFYPTHDHGCPHVGHCPHLGGAALGTLVGVANQNEQYLRQLGGTIEVQREQISRLVATTQRLEAELQQVKLELKLERQTRFATPQQKSSASSDTAEPSAGSAVASSGKKRGAPVGHPGWFRPTPTAYDWQVTVPAPRRCPRCRGAVTAQTQLPPVDHLQEDLVDGAYRVVLDRHPAARCDECGEAVQQAGDGEILGSRIGPRLRASAVFLRNEIGISYRKVPQAIQELFGITFTPAALIGFEKMLTTVAAPVVEDIAKKLGSSEGPVHADETYSLLNGARAYYWVHADESFVHFQFDTTRSGQVSREVLGNDFTGTLVTDCYAGYAAHTAGAKQKCLAHLARTARDWQRLTAAGSPDESFFEAVRQFVKRGCEFYRLRRDGKLGKRATAVEQAWLRAELSRLETCVVTYDKALTLQARIVNHRDEWLVFVDDPRVPPTNNLAERALRPLVVLRKLTFGHRSRDGGERMAQLMTVAETARRHGHRASQVFYELYTQPASRVLPRLYARE